jgi:hypothetical protein
VGKSTLADALRDDFLTRYATLKPRALVADTKPRYRAEWLPNGLSAKRLYRKWDHGPVVRASVVAHDPDEMRQAFALGHRIVIAQVRNEDDVGLVASMVSAFQEDSRRGRPQLVQVDETCDFYHGNGMAIGGRDVMARVARAGAERGTCGLFCSQRTRGVSASLLEHMDRLYAFRLDVASDAKRFAEFGCPIGPDELPRRPYVFKFWTKADYDRIWGPYQLQLRPAA